MRNSKLFFILVLLFTSIVTYGQEEEKLLLDIAQPWRSEQLTFPIRFAPSLDYKGIEEVRFAKGWGTKESEEFWTYTFLWYLDEDPAITANAIETDIEAYFDGLMKLVSGREDLPKATVVFVPDTKESTTYTGKAKFFDAFFTKGIQELNIKAVVGYCSQTKKHTVLFTFSPKAFYHSNWKTLDNITLAVECN